jgi:amino acid adenylation domain-containing protein
MQKSVVDYLKATALKHPHKLAVKDASCELSFARLLASSYLIATAIAGRGITNKPVCVYIPKGCAAIQAFAGISLSGNFYVPLDTHSPVTRIQSIFQVLESSVILTDKKNEEKVRSFSDKEILVLEDILAKGAIDYSLCEQAENRQIDTDPVYSIFTSGSTGTPKGVVISHRGVIDYIDWAVETFQIDATSVIGNQAPFYFDNSTLDIYLMYATGATLILIPEENFIFPAALVNYLNDEKITFLFWVPFALINVANLDIFSKNKPLYLKYVFFAGEVMPNKHLNYWRRHLPGCRYVNLYGPTEITVDCTYYVVEREFADNESLPIGFPCKNSEVLILTDQKQQAGTNQQGELCVRGTSLAMGYYNDWDKTKNAFIQNPLNPHYPELIYCTGDLVYRNPLGEIMYVGRKDSQIKHNGYRIELGEIETAVLGTQLVDNCCVVYDNNVKKIVLFYQASQELALNEFRKAVLRQLPKYMMPEQSIRVDELKRNANGKIDRLYYNKQINDHA